MLSRSHIASVNDRIWVFGAIWMTPPEGTPLAKAARSAIAGTVARLVVIRTQQGQFGYMAPPYGSRGPRIGARWYSAAAAIASALPATTLAVWNVGREDSAEPLWWGCIVRRGRIPPDGDCLFESAEEAKEFLSKHLSEPGWKTIIAPTDWGISDTTDVPLPDMLAHGTATSFGPPRAMSQYLWPAAVGIIGLGILFYNQMHTPPNKVVTKSKNEPPPIVYPSGTPIGVGLQKCLSEVRGRFTDVVTAGGWSYSSISCTDGLLSVQLVADRDTPLSSLTIHFPTANIQIDAGSARTATIRMPYQAIQTTVMPARTSPAPVIRALADRLFAELSISSKTAVPMQPYSQIAWTLVTEAPDSMWGEALQGLGGTILGSARLEEKSNSLFWTITGVSYVE